MVLLTITLGEEYNDWIEFLTLFVCPSIGCVLSTLMYLSPVADLSRATRRGNVGHLPTLPWAVGLTNCWGWLFYGYLRQNVFIMLSNAPGLVLSMYLNNFNWIDNPLAPGKTHHGSYNQ